MSETLEQIVRDLHKQLPMATQEDAIEFARRLVAALGAQEPVAKVSMTHFDDRDWFEINTLKPRETFHNKQPLYVAPVVPADWQMVPKEPTEEEIDAPRYVFQALELGLKNIQDIRLHLERCGVDISATPDWFKTDTGHLTKAGKALVVRSLMLAAAPEYKP